jgi:hypothetical protein
MCECTYGLIAGRGSKGVGISCTCEEEEMSLSEYVDSRVATWLAEMEIESADALDLSEQEDSHMPPSMQVDNQGNDVTAEEADAMDFATRVERGLTTIAKPSESPTLKRQQEAMRKADRERAAYQDEIRAEALARLEKDQADSKRERDIQREMARLTDRTPAEPELQTRADKLFDEHGNRVLRRGEVDLRAQRIDRLSDPTSPHKTGDLYEPSRPSTPIDHPVSIAPMTQARGHEKEAATL